MNMINWQKIMLANDYLELLLELKLELIINF